MEVYGYAFSVLPHCEKKAELKEIGDDENNAYEYAAYMITQIRH